MNTPRTALTLSVFYLLSLFSYNGAAADDERLIRLTTTTTTISSGLMDKLLPIFQTDTGYRVKIDAYGTGRALRSARVGEADIIIVHAPDAENEFMQAGHGLSRLALMKNEFIIAGPKDDPAGIAQTTDVVTAFIRIADKQALFISRGDDSGTHKKELAIWKAAGIEPYGKWYFELGQGMGKTLEYANKSGAYVLVDRGTWLARRRQLQLMESVRGDRLLDNPYHIIIVNPAKHPDTNLQGAQRLALWLTSKRGQKLIRAYTVDGESLFTPQVRP